jgi:predicted MFS family arabinose efflux permease
MLYSVRAVSLVLLLTTQHAPWLLAFGVLFGIVDFAVLAPTQLLASRYFAGHSLGVIFGMLSMVHQFGSALGAYVPGVLYDLTGSYAVPFGGGAAILVLGAALSFTLPQPAARMPSLTSVPSV